MGNCASVKSSAGNGTLTVKDAKFGKMKKTVEQTFTCFLAAAEQFVALRKQQDKNESTRGTFVASASHELANLHKYLDRVREIFYNSDMQAMEAENIVGQMIRSGSNHR